MLRQGAAQARLGFADGDFDLRRSRGIGRSWHGFWSRSFNFPVAAFLDARAEVALLGALLDDERGAALRARFVDRFVRRSVVTIGVAAAAVENTPSSASLRCAAAHELTFVALRAFDAERDWARVFAFRIVLATDEIAEATLASKQRRFIEWTLFIENHVRLAR